MMQNLKELVNSPTATIVDVRTPMEFQADHVQGALNIPLDEVHFRMEEFRQMARPLVLYCRSGQRSGMAAAMLKQAGIMEVYNAGGLEDMKYLLN